MEKNPRLALVGIFYDGYYDLWEDFLELKEKFWKDCPYPMYIVNQTKDLGYEKNYDVTVIHVGADAEYSRKVQVAVDKIDADYLLLLLDDFFMSYDVHGAILDETLQLIKENGIRYYSMPLHEFMVVGEGGLFKGIDYLHDFATTNEYTISCQPAIWEKGFLKRCIGEGNYNAWVFEGMYIKSPKAHTEEFLNQCKIDTRNLLGLKHGALQGKMLPALVKYYKGIGYKLKTNRPELPRSIRVKRWIRFHIPKPLLKMLKKYMKNQTVASRYTEEIERQMKAMNLD